jgi:hypothetical protein
VFFVNAYFGLTLNMGLPLLAQIEPFFLFCGLLYIEFSIMDYTASNGRIDE